MEIVDVNRNTLANLYEQFPESLKDLSMEGKYLIYSNERVDISQFNINDLLGTNEVFFGSLSVLSSEDIFKIIKLHAARLNSNFEDNGKSDEDNSNKKEELISSDEFYQLINRDTSFNEEEQKKVNDYYAFLKDLSLYEDFLIPGLRQEIITFRNYEIGLESDNTKSNIHQTEAIAKLHEFDNNNFAPNKMGKNEEAIKLTLRKEQKKAGYSGTFELLIFSLVFTAALTLITLYLLH